ncbi:hypothetical protein [Burkholderia ubonensis]|uniref:hypothetical protein n=1 Tax=Burkholderia ubonensis TaxID=101571 RepID=UPI00075AC546|nr:hypothetical protein [Burkholderia ubonensis]KVA09063.1 hypothetical protein WI42_03830 [Burkholderia ubonensis]KVA31957.1 hypothetical protein WI43_30470 [Burkholderia ubonensis]KVA51809.1 hypothetical protein WI46_29790 [Burkholderia ubonensis]
MDNTLKLRVMFDMVDNMTKPLQMMLTGNKGLAGSLEATRRELENMAKTQKRIGEFREMRGGLAKTASELKAARERVEALGGALRASSSPSRQMIKDFEKAQRAASSLTAKYGEQASRLRQLRTELAGANVDTGRLAQHERELSNRIDRNKKREAAQKTGAKISAYGEAMQNAGAKMRGMLPGPLDAAKEAESAALRIRALGGSADVVKFARAMKVSGQSTTDNLNVMHDALKELGNEQEAMLAAPTMSKVKAANAALFGAEDAKANDTKFANMLKVIKLRDGMKNEAAFGDESNAALKMLTATGGRVSADEWSNFAESGGDAAKQLRKEAFYYQMEPVVKALGGNDAGKGLAALSRSILQGKIGGSAAQQLKALDLIDPKLAGTKNGALQAGALRNSALLKTSPFEWLETELLPRLAEKGIKSPDQVKKAIAGIFADKDARKLVTTVYEQREQINDTARNSTAALGVNESQALAAQSTQGRELAVLANVSDLKRELGEKIMPNYNAALDITASATGAVVQLMQEHGTAASILANTFAVLAVVLSIAGPLMTAFGTALVAAGATEALAGLVALLANPVTLGVLAAAAAIIGGIGAVGVYAWKNPDSIGGLGHRLKKMFGKEDSGAPVDSATSATSGAAGDQGGMKRKFAALATAATSFLVPSAYAESLPPSAFAANPASTAPSPGVRINTPVDNRPPVTAPAFAAASAAPAPAPITINITPPPGVNAAELARLVRVEVERYYREQASRTSSRLSD